jgi:hypothetical protein
VVEIEFFFIQPPRPPLILILLVFILLLLLLLLLLSPPKNNDNNDESKVWSNALFFSQNFGRRSCFFSRRGDRCFRSPFLSFTPLFKKKKKPEKTQKIHSLLSLSSPSPSFSLSPLSSTGLQSIPVSWWGVVVASVLMFVGLAVNVMPAYSICVHLGLDHKPHLLPSDEHREHFRAVAELINPD